MGTFLRRLRARVKYWNHDRDLAEEIDVHRDLALADLERRGFTDREARWAAFRQLGNTTLATEDARAVWLSRRTDQLQQDLRYGWRSLLRQPAFTLTSVATLVLGLGLTGCLFTVFNATFLRPWPVGDPRRVISVTSTMPAELALRGRMRVSGGINGEGLPTLAVKEISASAQQATYTFLAAAVFRTPFEVGAGLPFVRGAFVGDDFLETMQLPLQMGPGFSSGTSGAAPVAVIADRLWRTRFAADPAIVGKTTTLGDVTVTIAGVLPAEFHGLPPSELLVLVPASAAKAWPENRAVQLLLARDSTTCCLEVMARLRAGATAATALVELSGLVDRYVRANGLTPTTIRVTGTSLASRRGVDPQSIRIFSLAGIGCVLVLLLACVNVANLELARGLQRHRELSVRLALGAGRGRIITQLMTEGLLLALVSSGLAYAVAWALPPIVMRYIGGVAAVRYAPDLTVGMTIGGIAFIAATLFSLAPAIQSTRMERRNPGAMAAHRSGRARGVVLAAQLAISTVLVLSAALLARSVTHALSGRADFSLNDVAVVQLTPPRNDPDFADHLQLRAKWAEVAAMMSANVVPFAQTTQAPISARRSQGYGVAIAADGRTQKIEISTMNSNGLAILGVPVLQGHVYSDDVEQHEIVVNEQLAAQLWPRASAIGQRLALEVPGTERVSYTVVGIARDAHLTSLGELKSQAHLPMPKSVPLILTAMTQRNGASEDAVRRTIADVDRRLSVNIRPLTADVRDALRDSITGAWIAAFLGTLALLLSTIGVFGVFTFVVEGRRREFGVRLALGASRKHIATALVTTSRASIVYGLLAGLLLSFLASLALRSYLVGVPASDPLSYAIVALALLASGGLAIGLPLLRALRVDPAITLRQD